MAMKLLTILAIFTLIGCAPEAEAPHARHEIMAMTIAGDFDGDGAADRAELWITADQSRLLIYLAARPDEALRVSESEGAADYLRTRPAGTAPASLNARFDAVSYQARSGEIIAYWNGASFVTTQVGE
jgi:hypothetical protein